MSSSTTQLNWINTQLHAETRHRPVYDLWDVEPVNINIFIRITYLYIRSTTMMNLKAATASLLFLLNAQNALAFSLSRQVDVSATSLEAKRSKRGVLRTAVGIASAAAGIGAATVGSPRISWATDSTDTVPDPVSVSAKTSTKSSADVKSIRPKQRLSLQKLIPDLTGIVKSTQSQSAQDKVGSIPVFTVCTAWGSPYMVYDDTGAANALYFMDEEDAKALLDEFLNMKNERDARIMTTTLARAMRQAANIKGVPTGQLTVDGAIQVMYYKIVPSTKEMFYANKLPGRENLAMTGVEDEFLIQERIIGSTGEDSKGAGEQNSMMPGREYQDETGTKSVRQKAKKRVGPYRKRHAEILQENSLSGKEGIPAFFVEGLQFKSKGSFLPGRQKSVDTPLFLSYNDCVNAWKEMRNSLSVEDKTRIPVSPNVEVFNLVDVVSSIERDIIRRNWSKEEQKNKSGLESIVFVPSSKSVQFVDGITARGNGKARLRDMR